MMTSKVRAGLALGAITLFMGCEERVVQPADVARVELEPEVLSLRVGSSSRFQARLFDNSGNALTGRAVTWDIGDAGIGTIGDDGTVIAMAVGQTTVMARAGGRQGIATLRVMSSTIANVEVQPAEASVEFGSTRAFGITVTATDGTQITGRSATWTSSAPAVATVDASGTVTGVGLGTSTITAAVDGVEGTASVAIVAPPLASIVIEPAQLALQVGQQQRLTAIGQRPNGTPVPGLPVAWRSVNTSIATVDDSGLVTAVGTGTVRVEAGFGGVVGAATVSVSPVPAGSIDVTPEAPNILVNDTIRMSAVVRDADGNVIERTPSWSSSQPAVASVNTSGLVRGLTSGFTYVIASVDGARDSALVRVAERPIAAVVVTPSEATLQANETVQLTAQVIADDGSRPTRDITWSSSDTQVATVSSTGLVTARAAGVASIRATAGGVTGSAVVTVDQPPIVSLRVSPISLTLEVDETGQLSAVGVTADGTEVPVPGVSWSSANTAVATVSNGTVTAVAAGSTTITASLLDIEASAAVTVTSDAPASLEIEGGDFSLAVGASQQLTATVRNAAGDPVDTDISWSSKNGDIATVTGSGRVDAEAAGSTYIVASAGSLRDSVQVTVTEALAARVEVRPLVATIEEEQSVQLQATVYDFLGNVIDRKVVWSTNQNNIVSVNQNGRVTGKREGLAFVTATADGRSGTATIVVVDDLVDDDASDAELS